MNEPDSMGAALRSARTEKRISIERAAEELKIRQEFLMRMESDEFDFLAPAYARGFLRSYVRYLGMGEEPFLQEFDRRHGGGEIDASQIAAVDKDGSTKPMRDHRSISLLTILIAGGAGVVLLLGLVGLFAPEPSRDDRGTAVADEEEPSPTPTLEKVKERKKKGRGGAGATPTPSPESTLLEEGIELTVAADDGPCWVDVEADGEQLFAETLDPGDEESFEADEDMIIVLGAPSTVDLMLNGRPVDSLDTEGPGAVKLYLPEDLYRLGISEEEPDEVLDNPAVDPSATPSP